MDNKQYWDLRKTRFRKVYYNDLSEERISFFEQNNWVVYEQNEQRYRISEEGRSALHEHQHKYMKWWIPVIISIVAILISLLK